MTIQAPVGEELLSRLRGAGHERPPIDPDAPGRVRATVSISANELNARWPALPANAHFRLQEPLRAELAAGRVVLAGRVDLALGGPTPDRAGSTLIDIKSGKRHYDDVADAGWYAV